MAPLFIDPGLFRKRAALQTAEATPNGSGGAMIVWREIAEVSVHVEPLSVQATERFDRREAIVTHRVTCRARSGVDRGMAFSLGSRHLLIRSVHDPDESGRYIVCRCTEEA